MLSFHEIEIFLQHTPLHLQGTVLELRDIIASVAPDVVEVIRWGGLSYFHEGRGGLVSAGICQIGPEKDHIMPPVTHLSWRTVPGQVCDREGYIRLAFIHGAFLSEPRRLFEGSQKYKRYISLRSYDNVPWDYINQLIEETSRFDPRSLQV